MAFASMVISRGESGLVLPHSMLRCVGLRTSACCDRPARLDERDRSGIPRDETNADPSPAGRAQKEAAAAQLAAGPARVRLCLRRGAVRGGRRRGRLLRLEGLARSARLREPRQVRAAGHDAHPRPRRQPDGRVRPRAAHLRADQRRAQAASSPPSCRPRTSASTSTAASTSPASAAPSTTICSNYRQRRRARGRLDHHPAGGQELPAVERAEARAQAEGGDPRHPHRARLLQGQDPRALSQRDLPRHGLLRRGRRRAQLLQQGAERARPSRRPPTWRRCRRRPTTIIPSARPRRRRSGATGSSTRWPTSATSPPSRPRPPRPSRSRSTSARFGTQIYAADYFAEDVRRTLVDNFGEDGLYGRAERAAVGDGRINGGLSVRTTLDPNLQRMARKALIDGLVAFDREKGWRGPVQKIDIAGDWGAALTGIEVPGDLAPWRLGVVLEAQTHQGGRRPAPGAPGRRQPGGGARGGRDPLRRGEVGALEPRRAQGRDRRAAAPAT